MDDIKNIIKGAYDLHLHTGPDVLPRKFDDIDMAKRCIDSGMAGFAIKNHFASSAGRAALVRKLYPEVDAIGMLWMNTAAGGLSPVAVELAALAGAKIIGFPTTDTERSIKRALDPNTEKPSFWRGIVVDLANAGFTIKPVKVTDDEGKLLPEVYDVLSVIAKHRLVLATGHLLPKDTAPLLKAAKESGVERIILTHVMGSSNSHTVDEQKKLLGYGAKMEHTTGSFKKGKVPVESVIESIKAIGPQHCILSTDLGQPKNGYPDEDMVEICALLIENGIPYEEVRKMVVDNPRDLVGNGCGAGAAGSSNEEE